eukprot:364439-Chlamydomonas_euryale.AAC.18
MGRGLLRLLATDALAFEEVRCLLLARSSERPCVVNGLVASDVQAGTIRCQARVISDWPEDCRSATAWERQDEALKAARDVVGVSRAGKVQLVWSLGPFRPGVSGPPPAPDELTALQLGVQHHERFASDAALVRHVLAGL